MPYSNAKKKQLAAVKRRGSGSSSGGAASYSGGRRPATTATNTTDDSTTNGSIIGNVNNNGRVNVPPAKLNNNAKRTTNRGRSSSTTATTDTGIGTSKHVNRSQSKSSQDQEDSEEEERSSAEEEDNEEEEEKQLILSKEQLVAKNIGKLSVGGAGNASGGVSSASAVLSESSEDGSASSPERVTSSEEEPASEDCQSFFVIVNTDGSLVLDNTKQLQLGPGQERFAISLPSNKIKSLENPLPGAIQLPIPRARKSKPEGVTYGGSTDVGFIDIPTTSTRSAAVSAPEVVEIDLVGSNKEASMSVGINPAHIVQSSISIAPGTTGSIDMDEFTNQLDPQSLATLETLIDSEQGRELIETMDLNQVGNVHINDAGVTAEVKPPGWDHSYTNKNSGGRGDSSASVSVSSSASSTANSPGGSRNPDRSLGTGRSSSTGKGRPSSGGRLSEGDGNIRRSQRQQDRIERQEAERILAENQQMLQREKEIMKEASAQKLGSPAPSVDSFSVASPVATTVSKVVVVTPTVRVASPSLPLPAMVGERVASPESDSKRPYPKRENRKLPAHLADPNYISMEDEGVKNPKDGTAVERSGGSRRSSTQTKQEEPEEEIDNTASAEDDDEDYTEDDPNRLWCICRQPHNNRFMICCDTCEDWFHGKCVNVTKAQGKAMELKNMSWNCPPCRKILVERAKKAAETPQSRGRAVSRRASESTGKSSTKLSKAAVAQQAEAAAAATAAKLAQTPEKIAAQSTGGSRKSNFRKSELEKVVAEDNVQDCVVCGKASRKDSIYCSDLCVQKYAESVGKKSTSLEKPKAGATSSQAQSPILSTPPTSTPGKDKLKRTNSLRAETKSDEPIFAFHVITPGATKSTEIVPPKPKELTASQLLKAQREQAAIAAAQTSPIKTSVVSIPVTPAASHPTVQGVSPNSVNAIMSSTPTVVVKKMTTADGKSFVKLPGKISKEIPLKIDTLMFDEKSRGKDKESVMSPTKTRARAGSSSTSEGKNKPAVTRKTSLKSTEKEKDQPTKDKDGILSEKLQRENMRKSIREILKTRAKEMTDEEQRKIASGSNTPEILAGKIEEELIRFHGGASNPKCRSKYRSIFFNLKDSKNVLYQEILKGNLKPRVLVKMEPHELASAELSEWRKRETEKEIEAIKKAELDKYAETKKIQLLEKGVDDAVKVAEESRPLHISDIIISDSKEKGQDVEKEKSGYSGEKSNSSSKSYHTKTRGKDSSKSSDKDSMKASEKEKERDRRDKDRRRSDRHKSDKDRESSSKEKEKDRRTRGKERESSKVKYSDSKDRDRKHSKGKESDKHRLTINKEEISKSPVDSEHKKISDSEITTPTEASTSEDGTPSSQATSSDSKKSDVRHSTDSEQELPSSTIKTPDFADEASYVKKDSESKPLFQTRIIMPELGGFNASSHAVSHFSTEGLVFPESPVPIVGRISPETVWDYINKMKKSKEVIVFRLSPATPADSEGYMTFFSYFSSRGRLAVLGGIAAPLKDVYLVPLDKHSPVNRSLLPFRGPGLPKERTHCLLCVVTRHIQGDASVPMPLKRKSTVPDQLAAAAKKKVKLGQEKQKSKSSNSLSRSTPSSVPEIPTSSKPATVEIEVKEDDDAPYTPWEEEDEKDEVKEVLSKDTESSLASLRATVGKLQSASPSVNVQKQLQELEDKIAKERQDIEKITGALAGRSTSGIPGLDGEFPEEEGRRSEKKEDVPFFLRSTSESQGKKVRGSGRIELAGVDVQDSGFQVSSQESMDICIESNVVPDSSPDVIIEDSSSKDESEPSKPIDTAVEDAEEAYSPSAMQFSDDETPEVEESTSECTKTQDTDIIFIEEPQPSTLEKKVVGKFIPVMEPVDDIKIVMKKPVTTLFSQVVSPSSLSGSPVKVQRDFIDLGDDLEPPPPGEISSTPAPVRKPDPVFEEAGAVFPKTSSIASTVHSKMKININLTTKQLPSKDALQENKKESPEIVQVPIESGQILTPASSQSQISFPIHLPPPTNIQHNLTSVCPPLHNIQLPPPRLQLPPNMQHSQIHIPVHIPPPNMKPTPATTVPTSVVINLNVPPPLIPNMISRPMPPAPNMGFPPGPCPPRMGFSNVPPPTMTMQPMQRPPFVPTFNEAGNMGSRPGNSGPSIERDHREGKRGFDRASPDDVDRVARINLDRDNNRRDRDRSGRDSRGRNFGRRSFGRNSSDRVRRNRTRSKSNDRDRSRSRSPRERRHRRRHSKSRSKSPLSKRWETSSRNKSRSRSPGKRNRHRSRSLSPSSRRHRPSGSPQKNATTSGSNSRSKSPSTPKARHSSSASEKNTKRGKESADWEAPSPLRTEECVEKQTSANSSESVPLIDTV